MPTFYSSDEILDIKGQPVVKSVHVCAPMNYFLNNLILDVNVEGLVKNCVCEHKSSYQGNSKLMGARWEKFEVFENIFSNRKNVYSVSVNFMAES